MYVDGVGGELKSPGYPSPYKPNLDQTWMIKVDPGEHILINFLDLDVGKNGNLFIFSGGSRISQRGVRQPQRGAPAYYLTNFSQKLHENEEILVQRWGAHSLRPLRSATDFYVFFFKMLNPIVSQSLIILFRVLYTYSAM